MSSLISWNFQNNMQPTETLFRKRFFVHHNLSQICSEKCYLNLWKNQNQSNLLPTIDISWNWFASMYSKMLHIIHFHEKLCTRTVHWYFSWNCFVILKQILYDFRNFSWKQSHSKTDWQPVVFTEIFFIRNSDKNAFSRKNYVKSTNVFPTYYTVTCFHEFFIQNCWNHQLLLIFYCKRNLESQKIWEMGTESLILKNIACLQ